MLYITCLQTSSPSERIPILNIVNQCDVTDVCQEGEHFINNLNNRYGKQLPAKLITIVENINPQPTSKPKCAFCLDAEGLLNHIRWPVNLNNETFYAFFRNYTTH